MSHDEMIEVIRAHRDGKTIEARMNKYTCGGVGGWCVSNEPTFDFARLDYRVKREPREWQVAIFNNRVVMPVQHPCETPYEIVTVREVI